MQRKRYNSSFLSEALSRGWLGGSEIGLLDVGASGGLNNFWEQFRPHLRAVGFDPLVSEVNRLNAAGTDPLIRYEAAWVGDGTPRRWPDGTRTLHAFTSAGRASELKSISYVQEHFNSGQELVYADRQLTLDGFVAEGGLADVDTVKVDVDSFDYFVLEGAKHLLTEGRVLVVECECTFHDLVGHDWPTFAEIDRFMRRAGYRLLDLDPWRYTRRELPGRFMYDIAAQTQDGQVSACDALYVLDFSIDDAALDRLRPDPRKLAKAILLVEAFGYPDLAAAMLVRLREAGIQPADIDIAEALDLLVPPNPFGATDYKSYVAAFEADPDRFTASGWRAAEAAEASLAAAQPSTEVLPPLPPPLSPYRRIRRLGGSVLRRLGLR